MKNESIKNESIKNEIRQYIDLVEDKDTLLQVRYILENQANAADQSLFISDEDIEIIEETKRKLASGEESLVDATEAIQALRKKYL
ncbi:MAG: hypothetical protein MUC87_07300 [Bacteroidia bacterium]|jgi:hypothetical protein|nr:hypothetical protein [Bacteroidia bacterium]